jgi:CRISPR system Cascade subunit CasB
MSRSDKVYSYVSKKCEYINSEADKGKGKAMLANLRHGIGKKPGESAELWGMIFDKTSEKFPEELLGKNKASDAEWAVYTALTLYALHRQGKDRDVNKKDVSIGSAAAHLVKNKDEDLERVINRLNMVVTATDPEDLAYQLRGIVQLLSREDIDFDYARLARDIYLFGNQNYAADIKLSWGRDFYGEIYKSEKEKEDNNNKNK